MADWYRIGVGITMADGVSMVLATLSHELLGLDKHIDFTRDNVGKLRSAIIDFGELTIGAALLGSFAKLAEYGGQIVDQLAQMRAIGEDTTTVAKNIAAAYRDAATVISATPASAATMINELSSVLANSAAARAVAPAVVEFAAVLRSMNPGLSEAAADKQVMAWLKGLDIQGVFVNRKTGKLDPQKAAEAFQMMKAALLTRGLLTGSGSYHLTRMVGPAASITQLRDYLEQAVDVMLGLGRTGRRGMQMAFTTLLGGNLSNAQAEELVAVDTVKKSDVRKEFGRYTLRPGAMAGYADLAINGVNYWFQHDLLPLLKNAEHGKGVAGLIEALKNSGGLDQKTADLVSLITQTGALPVTTERLFACLLVNQAQVNKFETQFDKAIKTNAAQVLSSQSWTMKLQNFERACAGLLQALGTTAAEIAIPVMRDLADAMKYLMGVIGANQVAAKVAVGVIGTIGLTLGVAGGLRVGVSVLRAFSRVLPVLASGLGEFSAGAEAEGGLALLTTGLPELAIAIIGVAAVVPTLQSALDNLLDWLGRQVGIQFPSEQQVAKMHAQGKEEIRNLLDWLAHPSGRLGWLDLHVPGRPLIGPGAPKTALLGTNAPRPRQVSPQTAIHIDVQAPLNVTIDGSLLGADYVTLNNYMQGWLRQHAQQIGNAVSQTIQQQQQHNQRRTMLDLGSISAWGAP